jgi:hypothetical protein
MSYLNCEHNAVLTVFLVLVRLEAGRVVIKNGLHLDKILHADDRGPVPIYRFLDQP